MHIILDHIKEGMDAVGKETPSHMTDFCGFCGSRRHTDDDTCPSCGKSQVIQLFFYCLLFLHVLQFLVERCVVYSSGAIWTFNG